MRSPHDGRLSDSRHRRGGVRAGARGPSSDRIEVGAGCCAIVDGETVVDLWGGYRDLECTRAWTADTLGNVYSTTKGIDAASFGHSGAGGSTGFVDPSARLGFGYVMNQMEPGADGETRAAHLIRAVYDSL